MGSEGGGEEAADRPILADPAPDPAGLEGRWTTPDRQEVAHWVAVYQELIAVCRQLLNGTREAGAASPDPPFDRARVETRLRHFELRQQFWLGLLDRGEPPAE